MSLESTKADDLALAIEEAIVSGELEPGTVLRQEQLSERFGVSRTPVREALRRLAALGLVSFVPNRGVRVRTLSHEELYEAFLVRAELESLATEIAATKMTPEALAELGEAERRFERLVRALRAREPGADRRSITADRVRANHAFHDLIYRVADVPYIETVAKAARRGRPPLRAQRRGASRDPPGPRRGLRVGRAHARPRARALELRTADDDPRARRRRPRARVARSHPPTKKARSVSRCLSVREPRGANG